MKPVYVDSGAMEKDIKSLNSLDTYIFQKQ